MLARCLSAALQGLEARPVIIEVDLAPADLRKEGPAFDLPFALALLVASGQLDRPRLNGLWCAGELGLDGSLRPCRGVLAMAEQACRHGAEALVVPPGNSDEAALIDGLTVRTAPNLKQLVEQLNGTRPCLRICRSRPSSVPLPTEPIDASGQAGRALALAAAGGGGITSCWSGPRAAARAGWPINSHSCSHPWDQRKP